MKTISSFLLAATAMFLFSCSEEKNTKYNEAANPVTTNRPANSPAAALPGTGNPASTPAATGALNPPHGEPNHRCDIAVGAPLNSPAQPELKPAAPQFTPPVMQQQQAVAPGTNPPHGQPGHDCAIPVGAPLKK